MNVYVLLLYDSIAPTVLTRGVAALAAKKREDCDVKFFLKTDN